MIDLSFLTEEEQEAIMKVLQRDAVLKMKEEERVRHLPEKIKDDQQLKNMSGQWFYEAKAKRHRDRIHGTDIIRASIRKKKLQVAAEQSKDIRNGAKKDYMNNVTKDAFLPPDLAGANEPEEDRASPSFSMVPPVSTMMDTPQENIRKPPVSPSKLRKNPFNSSELPEDHLSQQTKSTQSKNGNGRAGFFQTSKEGQLSKSKEKVLDISSEKLEKPKQTFPCPENGSQIKVPVPRARKMINKSNDIKQDNNQPFPRPRTDLLNAKRTPRGILKRNSSSSSTDSEIIRFSQNIEHKSKTVPPGMTIHERISEKEHSLEDDSSSNSPEPLKHVRFSSVKDALPQSPGGIHGQKVEGCGMFESGRLENGSKDAAVIKTFWKDPEPSPDRKALHFRQSETRPSASKNETYQLPVSGHHSSSEVLTTRPQSIENLPTANEDKTKSPESLRLDSQLTKSPADELSHIEPESSWVPDHSAKDRQQGKPLLLKGLKAKTSSHSDPYGTEIRKTVDDSISKVLDWFNRSTHSDDCNSSIQHLRGTEPEEKDTESQTALLIDDTNLKESDSKPPSSTKAELSSVGSASTLQVERNIIPSRNFQDYNVNINPKSTKQDKKGSGISQSFEIDSSNILSNMDNGQVSKQTEESRVFFPSSNNSYINFKGSAAEYPYLCNIMDIGNLAEEELKLQAHEKNRVNLEVNFDSSTISIEPNLKDIQKTKRNKISVVPGNIELPPETAKNRSPWIKPAVALQEESGQVPKSQVQREKYKRVSDRISFWEGETASSKLCHKESTSHRQGQISKEYLAVKSQDVSMDSLSTGEGEYHQVTAKQVFLEEDDEATDLFNFYPLDKPKETRLQRSYSPENFPSTDLSDKAVLFQNSINESVKRLLVVDSLHSGRDIISPSLQYPPNIRSEMHTPLQDDRSLIGDSKTNFKVMSLRERIEEPSAEQTYNYAQFENLRKFWNLGANPNNSRNIEKSNITRIQKPETFSNQKHKEFSHVRSSGATTHEVDTRLYQRNVPAEEEIEKLNSVHILQVLPDETPFPLRPPIKSTHHLLRNESSEETMEKSKEWLVTPMFKEEKDYSDQEVQEFIVKMSVLSKDSKDTFNDSLQQLLSEASSSAARPSGHEKQELTVGGSENKTSPTKTDLADMEADSIEPKEIVNEHVDKTVAPPRVKPDTWAAALDKLLKEETGSSPSLSQINLNSITTKINSELEEIRVFEKETEGSHNISACERKILATFPEGKQTLENKTLLQKSESGKCQPNMENLFQATTRGSHSFDPPPHLHTKGSFVNVANSPQVMPSLGDAHLAPHNKTQSPQREISETIEKVVLPPRSALNDMNTALKKLLREAWFSYPTIREVVPEEVKSEFPNRVRSTTDISQNSPGVMAPWATTDVIVPDKKDVYHFNVVPNKSYHVGSHFPAQLLPTEQTLNSSDSIVAQYDKELPQEVAEIVKETIIQPKSELLDFRAGIERLLKETTEISKHESDSGTLSLSEVTEVTKQTSPQFHPEEMKETIEKSEAPSITESAFDAGFEKLLEEIYGSPSYQPQVSMKKETSKKRLSQSEQARFLGSFPQFYQTPSQALEMMLTSNDFKSHINQYDKVMGGDKDLSDLSVEVYGSENELGIPETPQFCVDFKKENNETMNSFGYRDRECEVRDIQECPFKEPGFQVVTEAMSESRDRQPLLIDNENLMKTSKVEFILASPYKKQEKEEEKEVFSDSDFSDGNICSNAESWRTTSSSEEEPSPVLKTLERSTPRKMPSKSLEDISSDSSNQAKVDNLPEELVRSAEDVSTVPSQPGNQFSHPDKLKRMSKSVPEFLQDESDDRETDTASESSYQLSRHKKSPGSLTNLSSYSGMTSLSSVSGSVMSVYSGDFGNLEVKGNIQFAIDYMESLQELHVFVAQCKDLAAADIKKQRSDPYVKTYLLPDKGKLGKKKTLVMKKTLNPVYNEILRYKIEKQILKTQKLNLSVWHRDTFKRNSFLGEVELDLENWDWNNKENKQLKWYPLKQKTVPIALEAEHRGEMKLALQYVPEPIVGKDISTTGEVHIWVKECIDLPQLRGSHLNSFVKCIVLPDTSRKSRQKTRAVGKTTNPVFNHTMVYDGFRPEDLMEACVELTVWDHYKLTNQFLGGLRIGFGTGESYGTEVDWMDSTSEEVALWEKMVNAPNTWIEATLPLRMLLIAKISK
ncbi:synaptotagmin-like protein 2 isoform X2 [Sorex fumeus]|uniref:synaptotagmin-like protein 2 isoform X2 n=1 Tax=Sorex fumeus TaxID=62283 RepID=UPI0024AC9101|nr:synaptotagmin-like protein 2 isoform X2 [Sorex fumeus]